TKEGNVDMSKALDASLVDTKSSVTESGKQNTSSSSGNDVDADDTDIKPIYDEKPMAEHYKELYDSIKATRTKTIKQTTSLIAKNTKFKAQLQEKGFEIAALKNKLRKLSGNTVNTNNGLPPKLMFNNDLSKPVTTHYLPKERESAVVKPHHINDMVHNHYLEEAKKKTQESCRNLEPSVMPSVKSQSTTNDCKPKPRIDNQKSRNWHASKSSCV
ncbi:hypothetical protein Tco_1536674, partial [Tanacetum coccineum]